MLSDDLQPMEDTAAVPRRSLPKWPFLLADAVLVIAALAIWGMSDGLNSGQLFFCLGSVGLGAIIFVTPYVLEKYSPAAWNFMANDSTESRTGQLNVEEGNDWRRQARAAAEAVEHAVRANAALESSARRFDARFAPLVEVQQSLVAVAAELREAAAGRETAAAGETLVIQREFERLRREQAEKFKTAEEKITALGEALAVLTGQLKNLPAPQSPATESAPRVRARSTAPARIEEASAIHTEEPMASGVSTEVIEVHAGLEATKQSVASLEMPTPLALSVEPASAADAAPYGSIAFATAQVDQLPEMGAAPAEEKSMLAKALARTQSSGQTPAVAGIIMARARRPKKSKPPIPVVESVVPNAAEVVEAVSTEATPPKSTEPESWSSLVEGKLDTIGSDASSPSVSSIDQLGIDPPPAKIEEPASGDTTSAFRRSARAKIIALRGDEEEAARKDTPVVFSPGRVDISAAQPAGDPTQGELLAREAETIRKKRSSRSPVSACVLTARVLIGIGNKPFVRGTGPGLSPEKGVPMEFVEIGQWRWVAPSAVKEAITLRILKNDEVPAEGDSILLHPGQSLEVSPVFPA